VGLLHCDGAPRALSIPMKKSSRRANVSSGIFAMRSRNGNFWEAAILTLDLRS
jgi:hypothetical protein